MGQFAMDLVAPSGSRVQVEWANETPLLTITAGVRFAGSNYARGFQIGLPGHHQFAAEHMVPATLRRRLVVGNREVLVSQANDGSATIATLVGRHHELMTVFSGPAPAEAAIIDLFGVLDIDDQPAGMRVVPNAASLVTVASEHVIAVIEDRGSVDVPGLAQAKALLPTSRGAVATRGEIWRSPLPGTASARGDRARAYSYILGYPRGVAEVQLEPEGAATDAELLDWMDTIEVSWPDAKLVKAGR